MSFCPDCHRQRLKIKFDVQSPFSSLVRCPLCAYKNNLDSHLELLFSHQKLALYVNFHRGSTTLSYDISNSGYVVGNLSFDGHLLKLSTVDSYELEIAWIYRKISGLKPIKTTILITESTHSAFCYICYAEQFTRVPGALQPTLTCCDHFQMLDTAYLYAASNNILLSKQFQLSGTFPNLIVSTSGAHSKTVCQVKPRWNGSKTVVLLQPLTSDMQVLHKITKQFKAALDRSLFSVVQAL